MFPRGELGANFLETEIVHGFTNLEGHQTFKKLHGFSNLESPGRQTFKYESLIQTSDGGFFS